MTTRPATAVSLAEESVRAGLADPHVQANLRVLALAWFAKHQNVPMQQRYELVKDACQEAAERAWRNRYQFDPSLGTIGAWLYGILNKVLCRMVADHCRLPAQQPDNRVDWDQFTAMLNERESYQEEWQLVRQRLSSDQLMLLDLQLECLSGEQLAERLGVSHGTARTRLSRAISAARKVAQEVLS